MLSASAGKQHKRPGANQPNAWLHAKARLMPQLLVQAPPWVRGVFDHAWAPMQALTRQVSSLPDALCDYLMACEVGFLAICPGESRYQLGPGRIRDREVQNVAYVSVEDLAHDNERPLHVIGHLIDHHLGCGGDPKGPWLTDGGGATPGWQEAGGRLPGLFALGYGPDEIALSDVRNYFAQSLALYCRERQRLNVADPQIHKWFRSVLWNKGFWRAQERQRRKGSR